MRSCRGRRAGIVGAVRNLPRRGIRPHHRASTWAARPPTCRITPASSSANSRPGSAGVRMRAPMMSIHSVGRRRRLGPALRRCPLSCGPGFGGGESGPCLLPARRSAHRHRRQRDAGEEFQPRYFPHVFGADGNQPLDSETVKSRFLELTAQIGDGRTSEQVAGRLSSRSRVGNMANANQAHLGAARPRRYRLHAVLLRRRGGPARLPGRRCARHDARVSFIPTPGCWSAYGMGLADQTAMREQALETETAGCSCLGDAAEKAGHRRPRQP